MTPNPQDSAVALEVERAAFEAWAKPLGDSTWREKNDRMLAWDAWQARASQSDGTSGGWQSVPTTPTKEMIEAAMHVKRIRLLEVVTQIRAGMDETEARTPAVVAEWEAMLAAAPKGSAK